MLTFIIPVRHHANAKDWQQLVTYLRSTVASLQRQISPCWQAVIVANDGSQLPDFPAPVRVHRVDLPPNPFHELGSTDLESFRDAVRADKGQRILAGMRAAGPTDYFMVVDDDDYVSSRVAAFVERSAGPPGWFLQDGYVWSTGGRLIYRYAPFHLYCGTSHIVRADLIDLATRSDEAGMGYIKRMLGSHVFIAADLQSRGAALAPLPFVGAVYRIGHASAHSRSPSLLRKFLLNVYHLRKPARLLHAARNFRIRTAKIDGEFFGSSTS